MKKQGNLQICNSMTEEGQEGQLLALTYYSRLRWTGFLQAQTCNNTLIFDI
jgi:hypothetical protein